MNLEALYGTKEAASLSRAGAQALGLMSLQSLPSAISPLDTQKAIQAAKAKQSKGWNSPLIFLAIAALILWAIWRW
ncbi:MAG: hypothetical protein C7B46_11530 [Sulfobacillus benefaciens]|jgi:hypothetical protein|uniref:Uncharacterized protein n=1 Tax=Sulfobacillus benefaciens TaxID=453960 RepID=A0A2T2XEY5_9FIRM|nr:MAG: hypothetical protein C7B46_11530 [Sulfobacillus benefaciens]